jgi:hypothetical protein
METNTEICLFSIVITGIELITGMAVQLHCHIIVVSSISVTGAGHRCAVLCLQPPAQAALGRHWSVTDRPSRRSGWLTGPLEFFNVVIIIACPVLVCAYIHMEITLV